MHTAVRNGDHFFPERCFCLQCWRFSQDAGDPRLRRRPLPAAWPPAVRPYGRCDRADVRRLAQLLVAGACVSACAMPHATLRGGRNVSRRRLSPHATSSAKVACLSPPSCHNNRGEKKKKLLANVKMRTPHLYWKSVLFLLNCLGAGFNSYDYYCLPQPSFLYCFSPHQSDASKMSFTKSLTEITLRVHYDITFC